MSPGDGVAVLSGLLLLVIGWCLNHAQKCAQRDAQVTERLARLEEKVK
jgi:hypothetical protein